MKILIIGLTIAALFQIFNNLVSAKKFEIKPVKQESNMDDAHMHKNYKYCKNGKFYLKHIKCKWVVKK